MTNLSIDVTNSQPTCHSVERHLNLRFKRLFDIGFSIVGLAALFPLILICALAIKLDSKGPVFYSQVRWGKDCKRICVYKFRSLYSDRCDSAGLMQVKPDDPRVTRLGKLLRRTNTDEIPQLLNVLRGDMSVVGPRCHVIGMYAGKHHYEDLISNYHLRHLMRPGITGLAQANGYRGPTNNLIKARARIALDLRYIRTFSLWLDLKIILQTLRHQFLSGDGY